MNTSRLTMSSTLTAGRIKKFDIYQHDPRTSKRVRRSQLDGVVKQVTRQHHKSSGGPLRQRVTRMAKPTRVKNAGIKRRRAATGHGPRAEAMPSTHKLALQAVGNTQVYQGPIVASQFIGVLKPKSGRTKTHTSLYIIAVIILLFSSAVSVQTFVTNQRNIQQIEEVLGEDSVNTTIDEQGVVEGTGSQPTESEVATLAISGYRITNPEEPRTLRIPDLGVYSRIKSLGETPEGAIDAPRNINDVGWYDGSTRPGNSRGSSLLLGHVSGWTNPGVFKHIANLKPGARFEVEKGSGEKVYYEVVRSENIKLDKIDMARILGTEEPGVHDLKLMTCSGKYNRDTETYEERMVVYAKIIS